MYDIYMESCERLQWGPASEARSGLRAQRSRPSPLPGFNGARPLRPGVDFSKENVHVRPESGFNGARPLRPGVDDGRGRPALRLPGPASMGPGL